MNESLLVGTAEIDITPGPEQQTYLAGSLLPHARSAKGTHDPLFVRTLILRHGKITLAVTVFDIILFSRETMDGFQKKIHEETGIPEEHLIWVCTHTHSAPILERIYPTEYGEAVNSQVLEQTLNAWRESVRAAMNNLQPAVMRRLRGFERGLSHNRRIRFKNGHQINTWLLGNCDDIQSVGGAGPTDPETGILAFDDPQGQLLAVLYQFSLHANARGGREHSADYPGVVAARLKERFGSQLVPIYFPGACGDQNPVVDCDQTGNRLADCIIGKLAEREKVSPTQPVLGSAYRMVNLPLRDLSMDQEERIAASKWSPDCQEFFRRSAAEIRRKGKTEVETVIQAWHIGDIAFAHIPGELFVEWGIRLKEQSLFPWTYPVTLSGDYQGYMITENAWNAGGYESLIASTGKISPAGVEQMIDQSVELMNRLNKKRICSGILPVRADLRNKVKATIRHLASDDGERLARFYAQIPSEDHRFYCPHPLDRENALKKAQNSDRSSFVCLVLEDPDQEIAGYAWYQWKPGSDKSCFGICIRRDYQGVGSGKALMMPLLSIARQHGPPVMGLTVQKANPGAVNLYQKMGFRIVREQLRQRDQEPEYAMEWAVQP